MTLRYSPGADLALGDIGGASGEGKFRGQGQISAPLSVFAVLDFSFGEGVLPVALAGVETGVHGAKGWPTAEPGPHLGLPQPLTVEAHLRPGGL